MFTPSGVDSSAEVASPPFPLSPPVPAALPATVYTSLAVNDGLVWPHSVSLAAATSWIRLLPESAGRMWIVLLALLLRFRPCFRGFGLVGA